eukprot:4793456-Alexandrium_andersonii.AAC.1
MNQLPEVVNLCVDVAQDAVLVPVVPWVDQPGQRLHSDVPEVGRIVLEAAVEPTALPEKALTEEEPD